MIACLRLASPYTVTLLLPVSYTQARFSAHSLLTTYERIVAKDDVTRTLTMNFGNRKMLAGALKVITMLLGAIKNTLRWLSFACKLVKICRSMLETQVSRSYNESVVL